MAKKDDEKGEAEGTGVETTDSPLLDLSDAAVKRMIKLAKKRGFVTYEELNAVLPSEEVNSEQIKNILAKFSEMGINVVETNETRLEEQVATREEREEEKETEGENESAEIQQRSVPRRSHPAAGRIGPSDAGPKLRSQTGKIGDHRRCRTSPASHARFQTPRHSRRTFVSRPVGNFQ